MVIEEFRLNVILTRITTAKAQTHEVYHFFSFVSPSSANSLIALESIWLETTAGHQVVAIHACIQEFMSWCSSMRLAGLQCLSCLGGDGGGIAGAGHDLRKCEVLVVDEMAHHLAVLEVAIG